MDDTTNALRERVAEIMHGREVLPIDGWGGPYDWRFHVSESHRRVWALLTERERLLLTLAAFDQAQAALSVAD
jgi:hypothetical protein